MSNNTKADKFKALCQAQFQQAEGLCYLNHAAVSPWPKITSEAVAAFAHENKVYGAQHYLKWMTQEQSLRERLAKLLGLEHHHEIALAKSTSEALSIIAYGLHWEEGDEIVISNQEFPSNRIVWESLADRGIAVIEADFYSHAPLEAIEKALSPRTKLVSLSTVQYASGIRINCEAVAELCQQHGILLCLDAIQSLGALPLDQSKIKADFIVADGHKWLLAAEGLALLYVAEQHIPTLKLQQYGWHMVADRGNYDRKDWQPAADATRFECGSPNMLGAHALNASLGLLLEIGIDTISEQLQARVGYLIEQLLSIEGVEILSPMAQAERGGIVTFRVEGLDHKALYQALMKEQVICAHRGGGIRFSPGFYSPYEMIDQAIKRLRTIIAELTRS